MILVGSTPAIFLAQQASDLQTGRSPALDAPMDIIVTGHRPPTQLDGVTPDDEFEPADIATYGAETVGELVSRLEQRTGEPLSSVLINGRRLAGTTDISGLPPEALQRVEILPTSAASRFGYAPNQKVLNLVLRSRFNFKSFELGVSTTTDGGNAIGTAGLRYANILDERRINASISYRRVAGLVGSERSPGDVTDTPGALDEEYGLSPFRSLVPRADSLTFTGGYSRPVGKANLDLTAEANATSDARLAGLYNDGHETLPYSRIMRQRSRTQSARLGATISGSAGSMFWSVLGNAEAGLTNFAAALVPVGGRNAGASKPTLPLHVTDGQIPETLPPSVSSTTYAYALTASVGGPVVRLPAGPISMNLQFGLAQNRTSVQIHGDAATGTTDIYGTLNGQASLAIPIINRASRTFGWVGDLSLNNDIGYLRSNSAGSAITKNYTISWSPLSGLNLSAGRGYTPSLPSSGQLSLPTIVRGGVLAFDQLSGQTVEITQISGGNPSLSEQNNKSLNLRANANKTIGRTSLSLSGSYDDETIDRPVLVVTTPNSDIERFFPERFTRGSDGRLLTLDTRPFNGVSQSRGRLSWNINVSGVVVSRRNGDQPARKDITDAGSAGGARWSVSFGHETLLSDTLKIRAGSPSIDLTSNPSTPAGAASSRHRVNVQAGLAEGKNGVNLSGSWRSRVRTRENGKLGRLTYSPLLRFDAELFTGIGSGDKEQSLSSKLRLKLTIENLFNRKLQVYDSRGIHPLALSPDVIDPLGRVVRLVIGSSL